ncbi:MAG TPA: hypothetical protein VM074_12350 [Solimonas sp.]|nr:hypothetical protein [Solimonas sp.]
MRALFLAALLAVSAAAPAQEEMPAVGAQAPAEPAEPAKPSKGPGVGTTIVGERESPIGLYITPWRNAFAEADIDRPARLLQEPLLPIDEDVFERQVEYHEALSGALKAQGKVTPGK